MTVGEVLYSTKQEELILRPFRSTDINTVITVNRACLPENYPSSFFLYIASSMPTGFWVVERENGDIIAYIMCRIETGLSSFSRLRFVKKGHIVSVAVLPEYRREGIASGMLSKVIPAMEEENASESFLEVRKSNDAAVLLYQKYGFEISKELKGYYRDGESAYLMAKRLSKEGP